VAGLLVTPAVFTSTTVVVLEIEFDPKPGKAPLTVATTYVAPVACTEAGAV
jgi:hypothetical protein